MPVETKSPDVNRGCQRCPPRRRRRGEHLAVSGNSVLSDGQSRGKSTECKIESSNFILFDPVETMKLS